MDAQPCACPEGSHLFKGEQQKPGAVQATTVVRMLCWLQVCKHCSGQAALQVRVPRVNDCRVKMRREGEEHNRNVSLFLPENRKYVKQSIKCLVVTEFLLLPVNVGSCYILILYFDNDCQVSRTNIKKPQGIQDRKRSMRQR